MQKAVLKEGLRKNRLEVWRRLLDSEVFSNNKIISSEHQIDKISNIGTCLTKMRVAERVMAAV